MSDLAAALQIAIKVHADQRDKQGEPYLLHVLRVVEMVSPEAKVVAALHDVIEDSDMEIDDVWALMGQFSLNEATQLALLSHQDHETYDGYIQLIASCAPDSIAREVKLADLRDNLGRIPGGPGPREKWESEWGSLKRRYERAIRVLEAAS